CTNARGTRGDRQCHPRNAMEHHEGTLPSQIVQSLQMPHHHGKAHGPGQADPYQEQHQHSQRHSHTGPAPSYYPAGLGSRGGGRDGVHTCTSLTRRTIAIITGAPTAATTSPASSSLRGMITRPSTSAPSSITGPNSRDPARIHR